MKSYCFFANLRYNFDILPTVALKEYKPEKLLYSMGEVTEMFDVKPSLIRFWTDRFDILKPKKNKKGNRQFTPADVKNLEIIYHLTKERGMTLSGVEKYLKTNKDEAGREAEIVRRLQTIRGLLVEIREELKGDAEGEVSVFMTHDPEADIITETIIEERVTEVIFQAEEEQEKMPEPEFIPEPTELETAIQPNPELPNPLEFIEEVLPGEIVEDEPETDDFWSDEQAVEEMREDEETEPAEDDIPEIEETVFDGYAGISKEPIEWTEEEEEVIDEEVSVPFTAQPLFELEDTEGTIPNETIEEPQPEEETKPTAVDTQQSLF